MVFQEIHVSGELFAWIMIIAGAGVVASSLLFSSRRNRHFGGLIRGLTVGTILSLMITSNFVFYGISSGGYSSSYRAQDTMTFTGALAADSVLLDINSFNGPIEVSTWTKDEYSISALIKAKGTTDAEAAENLDRFELDLDESVILGKKKLALRHNVAGTMTSRYSVQIEVWLPADATIDLSLDSSNGGIDLTEIAGGVIDIRTSNGGINFDDVTAGSVNAYTSNGRVDGSLEAPDVHIVTSNAHIGLDTPCTVTGNYVLRTSNSGVHVSVSGSTGVGYDFDLSTSNGDVHVDLPDLDYTRNLKATKVAHTRGFEEKVVRITISATTSNGGIVIET
jgi:DUF4097 and DUF4098 domain-containing protein YvlB